MGHNTTAPAGAMDGTPGGGPDRFPAVGQEEYQRRRRANMRIYAYANRIIGPLTAYMDGRGAAFALFDGDGCLLKLYGPAETLSDLASQGIRRGTLWDLDHLGHSAVADGLAEMRPMVSVGVEHQSRLLRPYALYFAPVKLQETFTPFRLLSVCGVAAIVPADGEDTHHMLSIRAVADGIQFEYHAQQSAYRAYEMGGYALLNLDINSRNGKIMVYYRSKNFFDMLGIGERDILFRPAEELIDGGDENADFWSIVRDMRQVTDYHISLKMGGREIDCIMTTDPYHQPGVNVKGTQIIITTQKRVSAQVSEKMGNSAVRTFDSIIGRSMCIKAVIQKGRLLAGTSGNILLLGESGVGKDVFAQAIHNASHRWNKPFIAVNCGALPRDLIASELFGYEHGAFTGARQQGNIGKFELANGGTIFLDEIGELPLDLQATLLRVVEQKQFMRLGGKKSVDVDVKIIAATNADLFESVSQNRFRADLYYRLGTMRVKIPPLRERGEDILLLAEHFIRTVSERNGREAAMSLSPEARDLLMSLPWKGNVRELQNLMECIVQLYPVPVILPFHILENIDAGELAPAAPSGSRPAAPPGPRGRGLLTEQDILSALESSGGNRSEAARILGITRKTLYRNLERLGMRLPG